MAIEIILAIASAIFAVVGGLWKFHSSISNKNVVIERRLSELEGKIGITEAWISGLETKSEAIERRLERIEQIVTQQGNNIVKVITLLEQK